MPALPSIDLRGRSVASGTVDWASFDQWVRGIALESVGGMRALGRLQSHVRKWSRIFGKVALDLKPLCKAIPLHTRSVVLTWEPSSMVCRVKSISGAGFFCLTARMAVSK